MTNKILIILNVILIVVNLALISIIFVPKEDIKSDGGNVVQKDQIKTITMKQFNDDYDTKEKKYKSYNINDLVYVSGKVTKIDNDRFYVDDICFKYFNYYNKDCLKLEREIILVFKIIPCNDSYNPILIEIIW